MVCQNCNKKKFNFFLLMNAFHIFSPAGDAGAVKGEFQSLVFVEIVLPGNHGV